jgi:hypothetical protein
VIAIHVANTTWEAKMRLAVQGSAALGTFSIRSSAAVNVGLDRVLNAARMRFFA